ncbi:MAG: YbjN domain-containing protein [Actinomycetota bacterium]|nr:YbjN domain-containing protein [Actinomycetota bacterium]
MAKLVSHERMIVQIDDLKRALQRLEIISSSLSFEEVDDNVIYLRFRGQAKDVIGVKIEVKERTTRFDSYLMPFPESNIAQLFEYMLRVQSRIEPLHFELGAEDAIYLVGSLATVDLNDEDLSEMVASILTYLDELFPKVMSIGFQGRFQIHK